MPKPGTYLTIDNTHLWVASDGSIHWATHDPRFSAPDAGPGLHSVFAPKLGSANFNPSNFNRALRGLKEAGIPRAVDLTEIPVVSRRLRDRLWIAPSGERSF